MGQGKGYFGGSFENGMFLKIKQDLSDKKIFLI
jgi:hypothetical protein